MELNEYQEKAMSTCMPSSYNFSYMMLNLVGEVGEFASKVAKEIRKGRVFAGVDRVSKKELRLMKNSKSQLVNILLEDEDVEVLKFDEEMLNELKKELGDCFWQLNGLCTVMGWTAEEVCQMNLDKLASRQKRNVIDGNGDNR